MDVVLGGRLASTGPQVTVMHREQEDGRVFLSQLLIYPIKSVRGVSLESVQVDAGGPRYDRRWMLVDAEGEFLTQRSLPRMALISVALATDQLQVAAPGMPLLSVPLQTPGAAQLQVRVWRDTVQAALVCEEADGWFSEFLKTRARLVYMPETTVRPVDPSYSQEGDRVGFADGFPFLLISEASLEDLNSRLDEPVSMLRFRPNLVVRGADAYAEDGWREIVAGSLSLRVVKPCARCSIVTVNPETAERGREPLRTLAEYRRVGEGVFLGQNLIHNSLGTLHVGDPVSVVSSLQSTEAR